MTGYVIYGCKCLNIKLQLDSKYRLENHEQNRDDHRLKLDNPQALCGWQFEVTKVTMQFTALTRSVQTQGWTTVRCRNCSTGDVYSIKLSQNTRQVQNEKVIIHKGCITNKEIRCIEKSPSYSNTFKIVLKVPPHFELSEKEDEMDPRWPKEQKEIQQRLKKTIRLLEKEKEEKVQEFIQEQIILLRAAKEKARQEGQLLWRTIQTISPLHSPISSDPEEEEEDSPQEMPLNEHAHYTLTPAYRPTPHPLATFSTCSNPDNRDDNDDEGMFPLDEDISLNITDKKATSRSVPQLEFSLIDTDTVHKGETWFKNHDLTEADRNLSSQFAPYRRRTVQDLNAFHGRIIPPHIIAENTAANEKETLFGSLPNQRRRSSCRPID
ncbi:hypothetical protein BY458DRAFT_584141 [Sporodiniella umbellata]|nr:hypothetical protein BY458DRAFT_584141 [Sporodiniella umbellata]